MGKVTGQVCEKHPDLKGLRYDFNRRCVKCHSEQAHDRAKSKYHNDPVVRETVKAKAREAHRVLKMDVLLHYGYCCSRCGEDDPDVLNIDHIDQNGSAHRKEVVKGGGSNKMYRWLIANGYPSGFRTLCFNCNVKTFMEHVRSARASTSN